MELDENGIAQFPGQITLALNTGKLSVDSPENYGHSDIDLHVQRIPDMCIHRTSEREMSKNGHDIEIV